MCESLCESSSSSVLLFRVLEHCAGMDEDDGDDAELDEEAKKKIELNMAFSGTLLAHINGFALIDTFSLVQQK